MSSEYEHNVGQLLAQKRAQLEQLQKDPEANRGKIGQLQLEIDSLENMFDVSSDICSAMRLQKPASMVRRDRRSISSRMLDAELP